MATRIFLTYDNEHLQDGAGAQLQRIIGTIAITRHEAVGYIHSPVIQLGRYQSWLSFLSGQFDPLLPQKWETFLNLSQDEIHMDEVDSAEFTHVRCTTVTPRVLAAARLRAAIGHPDGCAHLAADARGC